MSFISSQLSKFYFSFFFFSRKNHQRLERNVCTPTCDVTWREQWRFVWNIIESNRLSMEIDELWMWSEAKNKENEGKNQFFVLSFVHLLNSYLDLLVWVVSSSCYRWWWCEWYGTTNVETCQWRTWTDVANVKRFEFSLCNFLFSFEMCGGVFSPFRCVCVLKRIELTTICIGGHECASVQFRSTFIKMYFYIDVRLDDIPQMCSLSLVLFLMCLCWGAHLCSPRTHRRFNLSVGVDIECRRIFSVSQHANIQMIWKSITYYSIENLVHRRFDKSFRWKSENKQMQKVEAICNVVGINLHVVMRTM